MTDALDFSEPRIRGEPGAESADEHPRAAFRRVHRLRELDRRGRWAAVAVALALLIAPAVAFAWATPDWTPAGDTALMGLRALDVGTSRTPLIGQPSSTSLYVDASSSVDHPGPVHFYVLAGAIRLFGGIGMPLVSVLVIGICVLIAAWAVFRQLGALGGLLAAVVLGAIMFTTGTVSLVDPVSSRMAGYPLLCGAVLLWAVLCGDVRLLPLATVVVSFAAQQHLSVGPAVALLTGGALVGFLVSIARHGRWRDPRLRRQLARWGGWSLVVALVMWAPVLIDQLFGEGNLGRIADYARNNDSDKLGIRSAVHQVVHVLGLPPLLGQTEFSGKWLLVRASTFTWISAVVVVGLIAWLGFRWRRSSPAKARLAIMAGIAAVAGLVNGSSVPKGFEQFRASFYHWAFVLAFFAYLVLAFGLVDLARRTAISRRPWVVPAFVSVAVLAVIVPSALNPALDRSTNTLDGTHALWDNRAFDQLADTILAHRNELGPQTVLLGGGSRAMAFALADRGLDVLHPRYSRGFVDDDRLVDRSTVDGGLVLQPIVRGGGGKAPPGKLLSEVELDPGAKADGSDAFGILTLQQRPVLGMRLYLLDRKQLLDFARPGEL